MFRFFATPFSYIFAILGKQKVGMFFQAGNLVLRLLAVMIGVFFSSVELLLLNLSVVSAFLYMSMLFFFARKLDIQYYKIIVGVVDGLFRASIFCMPIYFLAYINVYGVSGVVLSILTAIVLMFLLYKDLMFSLISKTVR